MARKSPKGIAIDPNVRCLRVYPTEETDKGVKNLKTIGIKLSRDQGIHLARVLLAVTQEWDEIDITAYRLMKRTLMELIILQLQAFAPRKIRRHLYVMLALILGYNRQQAEAWLRGQS